MRKLTPEQKGNFAELVMGKPELQKWVLENPRRVSKMFGWCSDGKVLAVEISEIIRKRGYLADVKAGSIDREDISGQFTNKEKTMPDKTEKQNEENDWPEAIDKIIEDVGVFTPQPGPAIAKLIPWDKIFALLEEAVEAKKERDLWKALSYAWERTGGGKDILLKYLWQHSGDDSDKTKKKIGDMWASLMTNEPGILRQLQENLRMARKRLEDGDKDECRKHLKIVRRLLEQLKNKLKSITLK